MSTTGFAAGAIEFAKLQGIELRQVASLSKEAFSDWLALEHLTKTENRANLVHATFLLNPIESKERKESVAKVISCEKAGAPLLRSVKSNRPVSVTSAFLGIVDSQSLFDGILPNSAARRVKLRVSYTNDTDHYVIDTDVGPVRVEAIIFMGDLTVTESLVPLSVMSEYRHTESGEVISQIAAFEPENLDGQRFSLEMHRISNTGETHLIMRRLPN